MLSPSLQDKNVFAFRNATEIDIDKYYEKINRYYKILENTCFTFDIHYKQHCELDVVIYNGNITKEFKFTVYNTFLETENQWIELMNFIKKS